jgi:dihydrofolate reductase
MSATVLYMSTSLDGFVAGPNETMDNGLGDGGKRLVEWEMATDEYDTDVQAALRSGGVNGKVIHEFMSTGAVVAGRGTFEPAGGWGGDHHDGVPIFILTRHDPSELKHWPLVTYMSDVKDAMSRAKDAAGEKNVLVHGAGVAQLALGAGVLDEIELHVVPVLSVKGVVCSRASGPSRSASSGRGSSKARRVSRTCITGCCIDGALARRRARSGSRRAPALGRSRRRLPGESSGKERRYE